MVETVPSIVITPARSARDIGVTRSLFEEYARYIGIDLCFQGFEKELSELPGAYAPPAGEILLAFCDGEPAGCVAMRPLELSIFKALRRPGKTKVF